MTYNQTYAKDYLDNIRSAEIHIKAKESELEALRWKASGVDAIRYDKDKVNTSPQNYMEMAIIDCIDREQEIEEDKAVLEDLKGNAYSFVRKMEDPEHRAVIEWYYLNGLSAEESCHRLAMAERTFYYKRDDALEVFGCLLLT